VYSHIFRRICTAVAFVFALAHAQPYRRHGVRGGGCGRDGEDGLDDNSSLPDDGARPTAAAGRSVSARGSHVREAAVFAAVRVAASARRERRAIPGADDIERAIRATLTGTATAAPAVAAVP